MNRRSFLKRAGAVAALVMASPILPALPEPIRTQIERVATYCTGPSIQLGAGTWMVTGTVTTFGHSAVRLRDDSGMTIASVSHSGDGIYESHIAAIVIAPRGNTYRMDGGNPKLSAIRLG